MSRIAEGSIEKIQDQLARLELRLGRLEMALVVISHVPPVKAVAPSVRIADGTDWDPGAGPGIYLTMDGVTWEKL